MSGISLNTFIDAAQRKPDGEVRFAKDSNDSALVNKGTFGNRVSTWLKNIKEYFQGAVDPTRASRQDAAVGQFQARMRGHFRDDIADRALEVAGIRAGQAMTGAQILRAVSHAQAEVAGNLAKHPLLLAGYAPDQTAFRELAAANRPPVDTARWTTAARQEYQQRMAEKLEAAGRQGRMELSPRAVERAAVESMREIDRLMTGPGGGPAALQAAIQARRGMVVATVDMLTGLAEGRDTAGTMQLLRTGMTRMEAVHRTNRGAESLTRETVERAQLHAMRTIAATDPGLLQRAQRAALHDDSPLRGIAVASQELAGERPRSQAVYAQGLAEMSSQLVAGLGRAVGPLSSADIRTDTDRMTMTEPPSAAALAEGRRIATAVVTAIPVPPPADPARV